MKKLFMLLLLSVAVGAGAQAQTEVKAKPTTTATQKVHNTFSRHKRYKGTKVKAKDGDQKSKTEANNTTGVTKTKSD